MERLWDGGLGALRGSRWHLRLAACALNLLWGSGMSDTVSCFHVFTMLNVCLTWNVAGTGLALGRWILMCSQATVPPALSISIVRRGICVELKPSGVPGSQAVPYARLPQPRTSSKQVASASPDRDILS